MNSEAICYHCKKRFDPSFVLYHYDAEIWMCSEECDTAHGEKIRKENPELFFS